MGEASLFEIGGNVEFTQVLLHLSIVVVFIAIFEWLLHSLTRKLKRYPKYHEMMTKVFGELMILGFIGLCIKMLQEVAHLDENNTSLIAFQVADLTVFLMALALIMQSICVFLRLRAHNKRWDKADLIGSEELLATIRANNDETSSAASKDQRNVRGTVRPRDFFELVQMRIIRHFFLKKMGLPELFPFAKYLRQAQESQITHMIEVELSTWVLLLVFGWAMHMLSLGIQHHTEMPESEALVPAFLIFSWLSLLFHLVIQQYFNWAIRQLLFAATRFTGRSNWLVCLEEVATHEVKSASVAVASEAIGVMASVLEAERARKSHRRRGGFANHDKGVRLISSAARTIKKRASQNATRDIELGAGGLRGSGVDQQRKMRVKLFSRKMWHFLVVSALMINAYCVAFFVQCIVVQMSDIYKKSGVFIIVSLVLPTLINVAILQPKMMWGFTLVSSSVRVDVTALSEVVEHFAETVELRSQLIELILNHLDATGQSIQDVHASLLSCDPVGSGLIEVDELRELLHDFGVHLSFFGFNSLARLVFELKGTMVPYDQLLRLLQLGEKPSGEDGMIIPHDAIQLEPLRRWLSRPPTIHEDEEETFIARPPTLPRTQSERRMLEFANQRLARSLYRLHAKDSSLPVTEGNSIAATQQHRDQRFDVLSTKASSTSQQFQRLV